MESNIKKQKKKIKFIKIFKFIYSAISVVSTLTVFSALILFVLGKTGMAASCDDDLIMQNIMSQLPSDSEIQDIKMLDIHGFGNQSIIVIADRKSDYIYYDPDHRKPRHKLFIFDQIENSVLNQFYNLFGYGSKYNLSYSFALNTLDGTPNADYFAEIMDVVELTDDTSKEIVIRFIDPLGGTVGSYLIGIFSYSFQRETYYLLGSFPPTVCVEDDSELELEELEEGLKSFYQEPYYKNDYDESETFDLGSGAFKENDIFIEEQNEVLLIRTAPDYGEESNADPHKQYISVFYPRYNRELDELSWGLGFAGKTKKSC